MRGACCRTSRSPPPRQLRCPMGPRRLTWPGSSLTPNSQLRKSRTTRPIGGALYRARGGATRLRRRHPAIATAGRCRAPLCDVLGWSAAETATLLRRLDRCRSNSALQRARDTLAKHYPQGQPVQASRPTPTQQQLLDRYLRAWEGHDLDGFVALLEEDATFSIHDASVVCGAPRHRLVLHAAWTTCGGLRLLPTAANGQPAFAVYERSAADGRWAAHAIQVLTLEGEMISALTLFVPPVGPNSV